MQKKIKISVIVRVFNAGKYLIDCLSSITNQTLQDIEIICIDDGSNDGSLATLFSWKLRDNRITILSQDNISAAATRNQAIINSSGEFVCFIDANDFYPDDKVLESLYRTATENNVNICGGELVLYDPERGSDFLWNDRYSCEGSGKISFSDYQSDCGLSRYIYKRGWLVANKVFFPEICYSEESVFLVRALLAAHQFYYFNRWVCCCRIRRKQDKLNRRQIIGFLKGVKDLLSLTYREYSKLHTRLVDRINQQWIASQIVESSDDEIANLVEAILGEVNWRFVFDQNPHFDLLEIYLKSFSFKPRVSVVVPIFNVEQYLKKCLDSIRGQTYNNIEVLCVDNLSTDNSPAIVEEFCKIDSRFKCLKQPVRGLGPARNKGMEFAKGYFVYFVDSDDYIAPNTIELLVSKMQPGTDFVVHGARVVAETDRDKPTAEACQRWFDAYRKPEGKYQLSIKFRKDVPVVSWNKLYRLRTIVRHQIKFVNLVNEDEHFLWAYLIHSEYYYHVNNELYFYLRRSNSIMGKRDSTEKALDIIAIHDKIFSLVKREGKLSKYHVVLCKSFKADIKDLFRRIDCKFRAQALLLVREFIFTNYRWNPNLMLYYFKLWIKYRNRES